MGKGKKWVLLANAFDPTLMRNYLAFDTARELGFAYVPGQKITELWIDGAFRGCYTLMTPVQEGKDRVDINIENGKDFMVELESLTEEDDATYFKTEGWRYAVKEPEELTEKARLMADTPMAPTLLARARNPLLWLLERYRHPYYVIYTNFPGEIVYEDDYQIVVKVDENVLIVTHTHFLHAA